MVSPRERCYENVLKNYRRKVLTASAASEDLWDFAMANPESIGEMVEISPTEVLDKLRKYLDRHPSSPLEWEEWMKFNIQAIKYGEPATIEEKMKIRLTVEAFRTCLGAR